MKIGLYDSGIGGLTVLQEAMLLLPEEEYIYYADVDNVPYGEKSKQEIIGFAETAIDFLLAQQTKAVVVACNTATSAAISHLREKYSLPVIGVEPAVKPALAEAEGRRVLVLATPLTLAEDKLLDLLSVIDQAHAVDLLPMPELVRFAEAGEFDSPAVRQYLQQQLLSLNLQEYSAVVLGCTHFNYFKQVLASLLPASIRFVDGSHGAARHLANTLQKLGQLEHNKLQVDYYFSGRKLQDEADLQLMQQRLAWLEQMRKI